ncbi:MAG: helix-turn-helix domain-containing protein [Gemmatimonadaceae bacterium]
MRLLRAFEWPGNVRQLFTVLESAAIRADFGRIGAQHLPAELRNQPGAPIDRYRSELPENDERAEILAALKQTGGVFARAAELLGMGRTTLWRKLRMYGLRSGDSGADEMGR